MSQYKKKWKNFFDINKFFKRFFEIHMLVLHYRENAFRVNMGEHYPRLL